MEEQILMPIENVTTMHGKFFNRLFMKLLEDGTVKGFNCQTITSENGKIIAYGKEIEVTETTAVSYYTHYPLKADETFGEWSEELIVIPETFIAVAHDKLGDNFERCLNDNDICTFAELKTIC